MLDLEGFRLRASRVYSEATLRRKLSVLRAYGEFLEATGMELGPESLAKWMDELSKTKRLSPQSVAVYARDVLSYFDLMLLDVDERKVRAVRRTIPPVSLRPAESLTADEVRRLLEVAEPPYRLLFALMFAYARRLTEALRARIDLASNTVSFPLLKKRGEEWATFPLEGWVRRLAEEHAKYYPLERPFPVTPRAAELAFKRFCRLAKIAPRDRRLRPHMLRHSRLTLSVERGVPLEVVSKVLARHANVRTTYQFYLASTKGMAERVPSAEEILFGGSTAVGKAANAKAGE
jgi:integrase